MITPWNDIKLDFRKALIDAFDAHGLAAMLTYRCDKRLERLCSASAPLDVQVDAVIADAVQQGWLERLARAVQAERSDRDDVQAVTQAVLAGIDAEDEAFYRQRASANEVGVLKDGKPPFEYSCFISCFHVTRNELHERVISELHKGLTLELESWREEKVFLDEARFLSNFSFDEKVASVLCRSACMVVIFMPRYFRSGNLYCAREFKAMELLEAERLRLLNCESRKKHGLILPVVFRGSLPARIGQGRTCFDFGDYVLASPELSRHPEYGARIKALAEYIAKRCEELEKLPKFETSCEGFRLPADEEARSFIKEMQSKTHAFPLR